MLRPQYLLVPLQRLSIHCLRQLIIALIPLPIIAPHSTPHTNLNAFLLSLFLVLRSSLLRHDFLRMQDDPEKIWYAAARLLALDYNVSKVEYDIRRKRQGIRTAKAGINLSSFHIPDFYKVL